MKKKPPKHELYCSFCIKSKDDVKSLVAGTDVSICDECIEAAVEILDEAGKPIDYKHSNQKIDIKALGIMPRFKKLKFQIKKNHCFYLCPFSEPFNTIYKDHIVKVVKDSGLTIERADEIFGTEPIIEDIWEGINSAQIIIADVTGRNPNVMYEIGIAHTVGKPVVIITQDMNDVPFDLKHYRCIVYNYTPRGCADLEKKIEGTLRFIKDRKK